MQQRGNCSIKVRNFWNTSFCLKNYSNYGQNFLLMNVYCFVCLLGSQKCMTSTKHPNLREKFWSLVCIGSNHFHQIINSFSKILNDRPINPWQSTKHKVDFWILKSLLFFGQSKINFVDCSPLQKISLLKKKSTGAAFLRKGPSIKDVINFLPPPLKSIPNKTFVTF